MAGSIFDANPSTFHLGGLSEREQVGEDTSTTFYFFPLIVLHFVTFLQVIGYLERGTAVQKFCAKLKPERKTMLVETMHQRPFCEL